jgi:hypothetical protein
MTKKKRSKNKIFIFIFLTFTICKCCRPTAKWRAVCKLIFWLLIEAFPLVKSNSATRQWSLSAAKCKAVKPSSFFSSTSHWRFWIFERISSIALKNKWISFLFIYLFFLYIYISWQLLIHITTIVFFPFLYILRTSGYNHKKKYQQQQFAKEKTSNLLDRKKETWLKWRTFSWIVYEEDKKKHPLEYLLPDIYSRSRKKNIILLFI